MQIHKIIHFIKELILRIKSEHIGYQDQKFLLLFHYNVLEEPLTFCKIKRAKHSEMNKTLIEIFKRNVWDIS